MVRIKVFKLSRIIYTAIIVIVAVALIGLIASALFSGDDRQAQPSPGVATTAPPNVGGMGYSSRSGGVDRPSSSPPVNTHTVTPGVLRFIGTLIFDVDPGEPLSVLGYHLPVSVVAEDLTLPADAEATLLSANVSSDENELSDSSDVGEHILVEITGIEEKYAPVSRGRILIYHTHTYEAYEQDKNDPYVETSTWRTSERDKSIMGVGDELERRLIALGYDVIHDVTEFEPPKLGTAYTRSLEMLERRMANGEEYAMIIDLHRDAWDVKQDLKLTADVDGEPAARLMMLIGTGEGSDGNTFSVKPNWKENYKLADALTSKLNEMYPGICRDIMMKTGRYNQHISEHSILIEVGNNRNTLKEALNAMPALALAIDAVLSGG